MRFGCWRIHRTNVTAADGLELWLLESPTDLCDRESNGLFEEAADKGGNVGDFDDLNALRHTIQRGEG